MPKYDVAFYGAGFFLIGVLLASADLSLTAAVLAVALLAAIFLLVRMVRGAGTRFLWLAGLSFGIIFGSAYAGWYAQKFGGITLAYGEQVFVEGLVVRAPEIREDGQKIIARLRKPHRGLIAVYLGRAPEFKYGDFVRFEGAPKTTKSREVAAMLSYPIATVIARGQGSPIKAFLFGVRDRLVSIFHRSLPQEEASFLSGITLGVRAAFSDELRDAMKASGTTHLVALSGYNISIIGIAIGATLGTLFGRRRAFWITIGVIILFVLMTGAEASVVRAAIMGTLVLVAEETRRLYSMRNAIIAAAFFMTLANPSVLAFDIGFQLSFAALMGIVYVKPAIAAFFRFREEAGFLAWRENALTTVAAQLAVLPLLLGYFGSFPLASVGANILILGFMPATMFLGFLVAGVGFISAFLARALGWLAVILLGYELFVIKTFAGFGALAIRAERFAIPFAFVYYAALLGFILYSRRRSKNFLPHNAM